MSINMVKPTSYEGVLKDLQKAEKSRGRDRISRVALGAMLTVGSLFLGGFIGAIAGGFIGAPIVNMLSESQNYSKILRIGLIAGGLGSAAIAGGSVLVFSVVQGIVLEQRKKEVWMRKLKAYAKELRVYEENSGDPRSLYRPRTFADRIERICKKASLAEIQQACEIVVKILDMNNEEYIKGLCSRLMTFENDDDFFDQALTHARLCYDNRDKEDFKSWFYEHLEKQKI